MQTPWRNRARSRAERHALGDRKERKFPVRQPRAYAPGIELSERPLSAIARLRLSAYRGWSWLPLIRELNTRGKSPREISVELGVFLPDVLWLLEQSAGRR